MTGEQEAVLIDKWEKGVYRGTDRVMIRIPGRTDGHSSKFCLTVQSSVPVSCWFLGS